MKIKTANIILLTVDCLRADHLGCYGYPRNTTPYIDQLASKGAIFLQAISNGGGTPEAFPSILASVPPPMHPSEYRTLYRRCFAISEMLKEEGYQTAAFHSNPYLSTFFHYQKGFDIFEDGIGSADSLRKVRKGLVRLSSKFPHLITKLIGFLPMSHPAVIRAREITEKAIRWLSNCSGKYFLWLHFMDVHPPCIPPPQYLIQFCSKPLNPYNIVSLYNKTHKQPREISELERETLINLYDASIKYVDDTLHWFCNKLTKKLRNTVIIIASDHGEGFGEHGVFRHSEFLYDEIIRVPLIISGAGIMEGTVVRKQVSLMDIPPTIIDLLNLEAVENFHGESLISAIEGKERSTRGTISVALNPLSRHRAISYRTEEYKYIRTESMSNGREVIRQELYDIRTDPGETTNLVEVEKEKVQAFDSKLASHILKRKDETMVSEKELLTKEDEQRVKERLRVLGYIN